MKKHFILTITLITFLISKSQNKKFEYGLHGGSDLNSAYGTAINKDYKRSLLGFNAGGHVNKTAGDLGTLQPCLQPR